MEAPVVLIFAVEWDFYFCNGIQWLELCLGFQTFGGWLKAINISKLPTDWCVIGLQRLYVSGVVLICQHFLTDSDHKPNATRPLSIRGSNCCLPDSLCTTGNSYFVGHLAIRVRMSLELGRVKTIEHKGHWSPWASAHFCGKWNWTDSITFDPTSWIRPPLWVFHQGRFFHFGVHVNRMIGGVLIFKSSFF